MDNDRAMELMRELLWNSALIAGPILLAALLVGVVVSVIQVATQLQESTLSYVPKLIACALLIGLMGPWLLSRLVSYSLQMMLSIPQFS